MTQTHGPKFRLHEQYLKRAVVTVLPQVSAGHYPEFIALTLSVYHHISRTSPLQALSIDLTLSYFPQIPTTPSYLGNRLLHLDNT